MPKIAKATKHARAVTVIDALKKAFPPRWKGRLGGKPYTRAEILAIYEAQIASLAAVSAAHAQLRVAVARERAIAREVRRITSRLQLCVGVEFGVESMEYAAFGWKAPGKPGPKTALAKARMVERRRGPQP